MLPERSAESFRAWLDVHPGVEIICRDRAGCYAEGAAAGAPLAIQVADRWHLWHNLAEAVELAVARHRSCLQEPPPDPEPGPAAEQTAPIPETGLAARTRTRHAEVHAALACGLTITEISRTLGLERKTVRRYGRDRGGADRRRPPGPAGPARPAPGLAAAAMGRQGPQH
jgi:Transposase